MIDWHLKKVFEANLTWQRAHEELVKIAQQRAGLDAEEGRWLLVAFRSEAHLRLGFASFPEYIERLFGYSPRFTLERLRVAEALEELPALRDELSTELVRGARADARVHAENRT
jgi:hypothetical protein